MSRHTAIALRLLIEVLLCLVTETLRGRVRDLQRHKLSEASNCLSEAMRNGLWESD